MKFAGIYGDKPKKEEVKFFLRLAKVNDYIELQTVDEKGVLIEGGHLLRFEKSSDGKIHTNAYTSVVSKFKFNLTDTGRLEIENF